MSSSYNLGDHFERLIQQLVEAGRYEDTREVLRDGLRMVEERERKLAALDAAIARGLADADAGRVHGVDEVRSRLHDVAMGMARRTHDS